MEIADPERSPEKLNNLKTFWNFFYEATYR